METAGPGEFPRLSQTKLSLPSFLYGNPWFHVTPSFFRLIYVRFARIEHLDSWQKNQVRPEVVLLNSHDKSSAYQLHCGLFRLVCSNGLVADATFQRISIKHSGFNPDSVIYLLTFGAGSALAGLTGALYAPSAP